MPHELSTVSRQRDLSQHVNTSSRRFFTSSLVTCSPHFFTTYPPLHLFTSDVFSTKMSSASYTSRVAFLSARRDLDLKELWRAFALQFRLFDKGALLDVLKKSANNLSLQPSRIDRGHGHLLSSPQYRFVLLSFLQRAVLGGVETTLSPVLHYI
jgi:hypothetical protein